MNLKIKIFNIFLLFIILIFGVFKAPNFNINSQQAQISTQATGITEEDFFNTMFLKSEFFENWSDTNYFINPTLSTSKPLKYRKDWYIDFLRDSYSTGIILNKPSDEFLYLYQNWKSETASFFGSIWEDDDALDPPYRGSIIKDRVDFVWSNRVRFLHSLLSFMQQVIGAGMRLIWPNVVPRPTVPSFQGWDNSVLKAYSEQWDSQLAAFDYYPYYPFKDYDVNRVNQGIVFFARQMNNYPTNSSLFSRLVAKAFQIRSSFVSFLEKYSDVIINELLRVQNGGSPDYDNIPEYSEKILFSFESVNVTDAIKTNTYRMTLTVDEQEKIRAGTLIFSNKQKQEWLDGKLNFDFSFVLDAQERYFTTIRIFSYEQGNEIIYNDLTGYLDLDLFLERFFSNALIPIFENRSTFIESGFVDNLDYNVVMLNFFGLRNLDFVNLLKDKNDKVITDFEDLMKNVLIISRDFYKNYIRSLFDTDFRTYVQGFNREYGLIANNGFKIYPQYFYYDDKYNSLKFDLYSSYNNRFYNTKYGQAFNFDYSVKSSFNISGKDKYVFEGDNDKIEKYPFKYVSDVNSRNVGYNVFTLTAQKEGGLYRYFDFNFGIYNWREITKDGLYPTGQWWDAKYDNCAWYNVTCWIKNAVIWVVNNIPGVKQGNQLASGIAYIFKTTYEFFDKIFAVWKFSPALYNTVTNVFLLIIFMKLVRLL